MKDTTPYEVYCKLIGDIHPKGETNHDDKVLISLDQYLFCLQCLVEELEDKVLSVPYYGENSIYKAKSKVVNELKQMCEYISEIVKECEEEDNESY